MRWTTAAQLVCVAVATVAGWFVAGFFLAIQPGLFYFAGYMTGMSR